MNQEKLDTERIDFLTKECKFDPILEKNILSYKPIIDYIMTVITSKPVSEGFYALYTTFIDKFGPRPAGSKTLEEAIDYIKDLTYRSGIDNVTTENVLIPHWHREYESVKMVYPLTKNIKALGLGLSVSTPPEGITADVIVVNSFDEFDEIDYTKIIGKIVLFNAEFTSYSETVKYRTDAAIKAAEKGAAAVLIRSITPFSLYTPHTGALMYNKYVEKIPAAAITLEDADLMQRLYDQGEKIVIEMFMFNTFNSEISRNTIIDLQGVKEPEKLVIVSGHIDSWDVGQGAIDDGGGMMISWFVPVILKYLELEHRRTIRSILWTSEEPGLVGGREYLHRHYDELHNIDFILESDEGTFKPLGLKVAGSNSTKCIIAKILQLFPPIDKVQFVNTTGSEMSLFIKKGIPGASLLNKDDQYFWYHHTEADTLTAQNMDDVVECAAFWAAIAYVIADIPVNFS
ncbi:unnamed protein product [Euphydryas editha]|uniref:Carboxypeptidase Q n=1 Tax=Euphydryas editha TaxID=104508 RepID=A0AAU9U0Z6_EUPED|nr:unnamed protein product [Euphydryas editha]